MSNRRWEEIPEAELASFSGDPRGWLAAWTSKTMPWLLVHADDGVIWGRREPDGSLLLSSDVFYDTSLYPAIAVELRAETLQQARVFGPTGEVTVWRSEAGFRGRKLMDGPEKPKDAFEENHLLWGQGQPSSPQQGFTLLVEGRRGPQHAVPLSITTPIRPTLRVRHYIDQDAEGQAYVGLSRLVGLQA